MDFDALRLRFATLDLYRLSTAVAGIGPHFRKSRERIEHFAMRAFSPRLIESHQSPQDIDLDHAHYRAALITAKLNILFLHDCYDAAAAFNAGQFMRKNRDVLELHTHGSLLLPERSRLMNTDAALASEDIRNPEIRTAVQVVIGKVEHTVAVRMVLRHDVIRGTGVDVNAGLGIRLDHVVRDDIIARSGNLHAISKV